MPVLSNSSSGTNLELISRLQNFISQSELNHNKLMQGLLFGLLTANQP